MGIKFDFDYIISGLDDLYASDSLNKSQLLQFMQDEVYDVPMIYWDVTDRGDLQYVHSMETDASYVHVYNEKFKNLDVMHPKKIQHQMTRNVICELDLVDQSSYENSFYYKNFLKQIDAYNIISLHLSYQKHIFGLINFLNNNLNPADMKMLECLSRYISLHEINRMNNIKVLSPIRDFHLTRREHEVFNLLKQDYSYHDISERLHISLNTIKTHTSSIYSKLNIKSRINLKNFHNSN